MAKLKNPLLSFGAVRRLGNRITFRHSRGQHIAEKTPIPDDPKTLAQMSWRHMYQKAVALWHALSHAEKQDWESQARRRHMTGFAWFMSQALKPNPGLYLPLQGGTMSGDIIMAKNRILQLPLPVDSQEAATLAYLTANIVPHLLNEGARVYNNANIAIANTTNTALTFNTQRYDTDVIHSTVLNTSRLTCRTAGKYLIVAQLTWVISGVGKRVAKLLLNGATLISYVRGPLTAAGECYQIVSTIWNLNVGDYVEIQVWQNTGGVLAITFVASFTPEFMMQRIGA